MNDIRNLFANKRVLIWGFGREGQSTKHFLTRLCTPASVEVFEGKREGIEEDKYDLIIKSPGIVMEEDNPKYTSQTEIFLKAFRDQTVGITGTKGKSTTSSLLYHVLKSCGKKAILLGNIGEPCLDYYEEIDEETIIVFEMSCHQLAHVDVSPRVAVFLSFFEEHLDYYKTVDKYYAAKSHVTTYQGEEDYFFIGENVPMPETKAKTRLITREEVEDFELTVPGEHNRFNAQFVIEIATKVYGLEKEEVLRAFASFKGLPHRLEYIGTKNGIRYYDDSISTIPSATIEALHAIEGAHTVILGGMDRGIDYTLLIDFIKKPENQIYDYILAYDSGRRIYESVSELSCTHYVDDLKKATELAGEITPKGKACLLSPASASYGYFKNFEQRGEMFKEYIGEGLAL